MVSYRIFLRTEQISQAGTVSDAVGIHIVREKRVGASIVSSSVRQGARTTAKLYESAVVLRKS